MMDIHSYPKVLALGHRYIADILLGHFTVEEKVDGSQISFGMYEVGSSGIYELCMRSKGAKLNVCHPEGMFSLGVEAVSAVQGKLRLGWTYRGEYLRKPKHNALAYDRVPEGHIVIFDIEIQPNNFLDYDEKVAEANRIGFECVPLYKEFWTTPERPLVGSGLSDMVDELLEHRSFLGGPTIEGIVVKNYDRITPDGKFMVGKYVSEAFKEKHSKNWKAENPTNKDIMGLIAADLKTEARYHKAVQHMRDDGLLTGEPKDIGLLLKYLHEDIDKEESDYIKDKLYAYAIKNIKRGVTAGFAEWYKKEILKGEAE